MMPDGSKEAARNEVENCKRTTALDPMHCEKVADFSGHKSADYGQGGPDAAGPSSHAPGK